MTSNLRRSVTLSLVISSPIFDSDLAGWVLAQRDFDAEGGAFTWGDRV